MAGMMKLIHGDCMVTFMETGCNRVDLIATDPQYGIGFMGKDWDKTLPDKKIWKECLRVLKPGAFMFVMCIPRSDMQWRITRDLEEAGFNVSFSPIFWTFATGFPKASKFSKQIDKRLGAEREIVGKKVVKGGENLNAKGCGAYGQGAKQINIETDITIPSSLEVKALDGVYSNNLKPAVEIVLVVQKPLTEKSYIDQSLAYYKQVQEVRAGTRKDTDIRHGGVNIDDCRIPYESSRDKDSAIPQGRATSKIGALAGKTQNERERNDFEFKQQGRFPANLLISDDVLNDGKIRKSTGGKGVKSMGALGNSVYGKYNKSHGANAGGCGDSGSFSRFFSLDAWFDKNLKELPE